MPTRGFAYNPTQAAVSGTSNLGTLCIQQLSLDLSSNPGGLTWWMGPDETNKYVVAKDVASSDFPTPLGNIGTVEFWSCAKDGESFRNLVTIISGTSQESASVALAWLNSNNYWTNYTSGVTFSQTFAGGQSPGTTIENAWTSFRGQLTGSYTTMSLSNNLGHSITVTDATKVQDIANALRTATTNTNTTVTIGANTWRVAHGCVSGTPTVDSIYLTSGGLCGCTGTYTVRPMIKNNNWGGLNGSSCGQPTQTITLTFS